MAEAQRKIKLLLIGDTAVGKTSLLDVFTRRGFSASRLTTLGVDYASKYVDVDGMHVKLEIWDTAGQERFRSIPPSYYRDVDGVILVYDVTDCTSFEHVHNWMQSLELNDGATAVKMLVGNKCDVRNDSRHISTTSGLAMASQYGVTFSETSARNNIDVESTFLRIASEVNSHINLYGRRRRPDPLRMNKPVVRRRAQWCFW